MTPRNGRLHETHLAFVLTCRLLGKGHADGKKQTAVLNLDKPISKKPMLKKHTLYSTKYQKSGRNIHEKSSFRSH